MKTTLLALAVGAALAVPTGALADGHGNGHGHKHGNSRAAHKCRHGGYQGLMDSHNRPFRNVGSCVRFAAHGGMFGTPTIANARVSADGFVIPAGAVATISGAHWNLNPCDALSYGYQLGTGPLVTLANKQAGTGAACANTSLAGATIGPFQNETVLRIFLTDTGPSATQAICSYTFYSNGSHARVSGSNPWQVDISDSDICKSGTGAPRVPAPGQGNLELTVTVTGGQTSAYSHQKHGHPARENGDDENGD